MRSVVLAVHQEYSTQGEDEYVIRGNDVILKCKIPSFVADFVHVDAWVDNELHTYSIHGNLNNQGKK